MVDLITTDLTPVPSRAAPTTFSAYMDTFLNKLPTWAAEANALATEANTNAETADLAVSVSTSALAAANYAGVWANLTGALTSGNSVYHDDDFWMSLVDLADVTLSEPAMTNADWQKIRTYPFDRVKALGSISVNTAIDLNEGVVVSMTIGAALTLSVTNWPDSGVMGDLTLAITNGGAYTITWPTITWILPDGTTTTTFADNETPLQASGIDFVYLWTLDAGTTIYGKVVR